MIDKKVYLFILYI